MYMVQYGFSETMVKKRLIAIVSMKMTQGSPFLDQPVLSSPFNLDKPSRPRPQDAIPTEPHFSG